MLRGLKKFLVGWRTVIVPKDEACEAFDLIYKNGLTFHGEMRRKDGSIRITMSEKDAVLFRSLTEARDMSVSFSCAHGLPVVKDYIKHRPVIAVGLVLALVWSFIAERIVWDIRISGNTKTSDSEIIEKLESLGFGVGTFYPSVEFNQLHADFRASQDDLSWLSIWMNGAVADIQVREEWHEKKEKHEDGKYANIVATQEGVVTSVNVFEGQATVTPGDTVLPGQVLISGVVKMKEENQVRYEYAAGEVICSVCEPIDIAVSLSRTEKQYTGREKREKTVKIFKKNVNLFVNGGKSIPYCDKIDKVERICLFDEIRLPLWVKTAIYREYTEEEVSVSPEDAAREAVSALSDTLKSLAKRGTMTEKQLDFKYENGVYRISGEVYLDCDIGQVQEFVAK